MSSLQNNKDSILNFKDYLKLNESALESERLLCVEVFKDIVNKISKGPHSLEYSSFKLSIDDDDVNYEADLLGGTSVSIYDIDLHIKLKTTQNNISQNLLRLFKSNNFNINEFSELVDLVGGDVELLKDLGEYDDGEIDIYIGPFETSGTSRVPWTRPHQDGDELPLEWGCDDDFLLINITTDGHDSVETKIYPDRDPTFDYVNRLLDFMDECVYPENIEWEFMRKK